MKSSLGFELQEEAFLQVAGANTWRIESLKDGERGFNVGKGFLEEGSDFFQGG